MAQEGDKSEEPTPHRLREARERGQVAKSREITTAILLLLSYMVFRWTGPASWNELLTMTRDIMLQIPNAVQFTIPFVGLLLLMGVRAMAFALMPILLITFAAALIAEALQTGFLFSADPLTPKFERINPLEGFKRMFSLQGLVELIKSIIKIVIVFYIAWVAVKNDLAGIVILMDADPWAAISMGGELAFRIAFRVGLFYIAIAILDYLYRRWEYMRGLKMTKQEVKEEYKRLEGDPMVKQRMRDLQRQAAYQRMMSSVPQADVVVTNPTHIAVAMQYKQGDMKAPKVLAKGERIIAEEIRQIAERHNVPIYPDEPLARSIYRTTPVGQEVPPDLYQAVAEVLAFVYKRKKEAEVRKNARRFRPQEGRVHPASAGA